MKSWHGLFWLLACCCQSPHTANPTTGPEGTTQPVVENIAPPAPPADYNWKGTIDPNIPVFIHYIIDSNVVIGEITYLNTAQRRPIRLLGTIDKDQAFRLLEMDKKGNVSGIITGTPSGNGFTGSWFSPKTRKDLSIRLSQKDTLVLPADHRANLTDLAGEYRYQYSEDGASGSVTIQQVDAQHIAFRINAVTAPPAYNIADVALDTVALTRDRLTYLISGSNQCDFEIRFFNGFLSIDYLHGYCEGQFGNNASVDGIFVRIK